MEKVLHFGTLAQKKRATNTAGQIETWIRGTDQAIRGHVKDIGVRYVPMCHVSLPANNESDCPAQDVEFRSSAGSPAS